MVLTRAGKQEPQLVRVKFVRNRCYEGVDYGPDYKRKVCEVTPYWARVFEEQGAAVILDSAAKDPEPESGKQPEGGKGEDGGKDKDPEAKGGKDKK